ncbi:MAG TPA: DUF1573 domain-containing protein [Parasegetibacter sp.]
MTKRLIIFPGIAHLFLLGALFLTACNNSGNTNDNNDKNTQELKRTNADNSSLTTIQWIDSIKNVGRILEGQQLVLSFRFKNTGDKPLVISSVVPGCGCTVVEKPEKPVPPGQEGEIRGVFDSNGRVGAIHKNITVYTNTKDRPVHELLFVGEVVRMK